MSRGLLSLIKQDVVLTWRNGLILVTAVTLAIIVLIYWTLPLMVKEEEPLAQSQVFLDLTEDQAVVTFFTEHGKTPDTAVDREELESIITEKAGTIGVVVTGTRDNIDFQLIFRNKPSDETINILEAVFRNVAASIRGETFGANTSIRLLRTKADPLASNESLILVMLAFEVLILGFLFIAVVVFGEKKEGSIKAYRVSPSGLANYVISKTLVFTIISLLYGLIMVAVTVGFDVNFAALALILTVSCALMTLLGLGVAVFFENLSQWFVPGVLLLSINMLAILPFQMPSYSLGALTILPGYNVIFGVSEALFSSGKTGFLGPIMLKLGIGAIISGIFALLAVRRKMLREG